MNEPAHDVSEADYESLGDEGQALINAIRDGWQFDTATEARTALMYARQADLIAELRDRVNKEGATLVKDERAYAHPALAHLHTLTQAVAGYLATFQIEDKPKPLSQRQLHAQHAAKMRWANSERSA